MKNTPEFSGVFLLNQLFASAGDLCGNFLSEVVFLLLDALTLDVVDSIDELDLADQLLSSVSNLASDFTLEDVGADEVLLQQAALLEESVDLTSSDLFLDLCGLGSHLGIVVHQSDLNSQLLVNVSLGNLALVPVLGIHSSDLHSHVLTNFGSVHISFQVDQNTVAAAHVDVSDGSAGIVSTGIR